MFLVIAFLGGMINLLSPCTLPVIPLLFAGFQGQRRHILALLAGMIVMFTLVAMAVTVASEWIAEATIVGRWIALVILATAALALIFPSFAQRIAGPAVSAGNVLNTRSGQTRGMASAFLAGLAVARHEWLLVLACDAPQVDDALLTSMLTKALKPSSSRLPTPAVSDALRASPSLSPDVPYDALSMAPVKSRRRMMLTTPAMASEP